MIDKNPLVWMAEVDGLLVDLRQMPREIPRSRRSRSRRG
jgi:hypothetical protein